MHIRKTTAMNQMLQNTELTLYEICYINKFNLTHIIITNNLENRWSKAGMIVEFLCFLNEPTLSQKPE